MDNHSAQTLKVLIIEDYRPDAELAIRQIRRDGLEVTADVVDGREETFRRLRSDHYDVVLADYQLPGWTGIEVLELMKKAEVSIPVILVTGAVGEEIAVDCLRRGVADYILKNRLVRLPQAIRMAIEEKKLREQAKRADEDRTRLAMAIEQCAEAVLITNAKGTIEYVNPRFSKVTGYTRLEAIGRNPRILKSGHHPDSFYEEFWKTISSGGTWHGEFVNRRKNGEIYIDQLHVAPVRDAEGNITHYISNQMDVTEQRRAEAEHLVLATAIEQAAEAVVITNGAGKIQYVNPAFTRMTGYPADKVLGRKSNILKSGVHGADFYKDLWATVLFGSVWHGEIVNRRKDGSLYTEEMTITPVRDRAGAITNFIAIKQDIGERKRAEEALKASEFRYRRLFETSETGILLLDSVSARIVDYNPAALRMLEETPGHIVGKSPWQLPAFIHGGSPRISIRDMPGAEVPLLPKSGQPMEVELGAVSYQLGDRTVVQCTLRDITVRRRAERDAKAANDLLEERVATRTQELAALNEELAAEIAERKEAKEALDKLQRETELLINSAGEAIFRVGSDRTCTFANPAAERLLGYSREEIMGRNLHQLCQHRLADGSPCPPEQCQVFRTFRDATVQSDENQILTRKDGSSIWTDIVTAPITEAGEIVGVVVMAHDVSERHAIAKMKDGFVSMVSHELRTPLTAIRGALGLIGARSSGGLSDRDRRMVEIAINNTDRLVRLVNDVLDSERLESQEPALTRKSTTASALMLQAGDLMRSLAETDGVSLEIQPQDVTLNVDPDAILQALTNLLSNAIKFSPAGGMVRLECRQEDSKAEFRVTDQGPGIPPDKLESIFGRFQPVDASDSRRRGGTGLGLSICRAIAQRHGGQVRAESEPGHGSTFVFTLPLEGRDWGPGVRG